MDKDKQPEENPVLRRLPMLDGKILVTSALSGAEYHLNRLNEIFEIAESRWRLSPDFDHGEILTDAQTNEILWRLRSFFWELVGVFDLMMQWINDSFYLGIRVDKLRWENFTEILRNNKDNDCISEIHNTLCKGWNSGWYFEVRTYRNYAHRSFLPLNSLMPRQPGRILFLLEAAIKDGPPLIIREGLPKYVEEMRNLCRKVFLLSNAK
jgi:hypothetical protein